MEMGQGWELGILIVVSLKLFRGKFPSFSGLIGTDVIPLSYSSVVMVLYV